MPVPFDLSSATIVGEPARVVSLTMLVVVEYLKPESTRAETTTETRTRSQ